jgi:hypothetical protein
MPSKYGFHIRVVIVQERRNPVFDELDVAVMTLAQRHDTPIGRPEIVVINNKGFGTSDHYTTAHPGHVASNAKDILVELLEVSYGSLTWVI